MNKLTYRKLFAITISIITLCVGIISFQMVSRLYNQREYLIDTQINRLDTLNSLATASLHDYLEKIRLSFNASDFWLSSNENADPRFDSDFIELINLFEISMAGKIDIRLVSKDGGLYYIPSENLEPLADVSDRQYFIVQQSPETKGFQISDPVLSRVTGIWGIPFSFPLSSQNKGISVIFAALEIPKFVELFDSYTMKQDGLILLVRADGTVLGTSPYKADFVGKSISNMDIWKNHVLTDSDNHTYSVTTELDGKERYVLSNKVKDYPIYIISSCDKVQVLELWQDLLIQNILSIVLVVITFFFLGKFIYNLIQRLETALNIITENSHTDHLTGLFNRRLFNERFNIELQRAERYGTPFTLAEIDIDYFKRINDTFGHDVGDRVLVIFSALLKDNIRESDILARWGGEEFVILFTSTPLEQAIISLEKLVTLVKKTDFGLNYPISFSAGVTQYHKGDQCETMLTRADSLLYLSKTNGRDQITS